MSIITNVEIFFSTIAFNRSSVTDRGTVSVEWILRLPLWNCDSLLSLSKNVTNCLWANLSSIIPVPVIIPVIPVADIWADCYMGLQHHHLQKHKSLPRRPTLMLVPVYFQSKIYNKFWFLWLKSKCMIFTDNFILTITFSLNWLNVPHTGGLWLSAILIFNVCNSDFFLLFSFLPRW